MGGGGGEEGGSGGECGGSKDDSHPAKWAPPVAQRDQAA